MKEPAERPCDRGGEPGRNSPAHPVQQFPSGSDTPPPLTQGRCEYFLRNLNFRQTPQAGVNLKHRTRIGIAPGAVPHMEFRFSRERRPVPFVQPAVAYSPVLFAFHISPLSLVPARRTRRCSLPLCRRSPTQSTEVSRIDAISLYPYPSM